MHPPPTTRLRWNWPHLLLLAALPPFAWAARAAGFGPAATLSTGTLLALAGLMLAERRWPARRTWAPAAQDLRRDGAFLGLGAAADAAGALLLSGLALHWAGSGTPGIAAAWSPWLAVPAAVVLGELGPYALHRWSHHSAWGWRVHAVHHAPQRLHASNNLTTHPLNVLWNQLARTLPWLLLGFDAWVMAGAALFMQVQSFAVHANIGGTIGVLNRWIVSAELHRWHHSQVPGEARNYATALTLWDRVFGSYRAASAGGPAHVGIAGRPPPQGWRDWGAMLMAPLCRRCAAGAARH